MCQSVLYNLKTFCVLNVKGERKGSDKAFFAITDAPWSPYLGYIKMAQTMLTGVYFKLNSAHVF